MFAVIGTYWGTGDGSTTFSLPPTPGRALIGPGSVTDDGGLTEPFTFATKTGYLQQPIAQANLPAITLTSDTIGSHAHGGAATGGNHTHTIDAQGNHIHTTDVQGAHSHTTDVQGNHSHAYRYTSFVGGAGYQPGSGLAESDVSLQTDVQGAHQHGTDVQGAHGHNLSTAGLHAHNASYSGNLQLGIQTDGLHTHGVPLGGSGNALWILNPVLVCTKIIYAGSQAAMSALGIAPQRQRLSAPLRGGMRRLTAA